MFDAEPVPNQEVILNRMGGDNFVSRLDLTKGFWQVPIKEEDRKYTAFSTDQGLMQFKYMPFGLVNALAIFCMTSIMLTHMWTISCRIQRHGMTTCTP